MIAKADLVLRGGRVFQGLAEGTAEAIAVSGERVVATGTATEIDATIGRATTVIDLRGRTVVPGFHDAHQHLLPLGMGLTELDLHPDQVKTLDDVLSRVKERVQRTAPGGWVIGGRYDHFHLDVKRHPFRDELDRVSPDNPVYLRRTDGHMGVANSLALAAAGITEGTPQPPGGHVEQRDGRLTGLVQERAQELIFAAMPRMTITQLVDGIEAGGRLLLSQGITSVMDAGVGLRQGYDDYLAYQEARRRQRLPVRVYLSITGGPQGIQQRVHDERLVTGAGDARLRVGSVKLFTDGSAGGRTAAMFEPYLPGADGTTTTGILVFSDTEMNEMVEYYHRLGNQVSIHAIGDAAIEQAIRAVDRALMRRPVPGRRHRIEHCGFVTPGQVQDMARLGMTLAPQPVFIYEFGDLYIDVLGEKRPASCYPMQTWITAGLRPAASTDAPVSDSNPMTNLYPMLTRKTKTGRVLGAAERIGLADALHSMTWNGAWGSFSEDDKGRLVAGQLADLAVLERDIFDASADEIRETRVDITVLGGAVVHDRTGEAVR
jgi:predicted amidohydrolase YtcJ